VAAGKGLVEAHEVGHVARPIEHHAAGPEAQGAPVHAGGDGIAEGGRWRGVGVGGTVVVPVTVAVAAATSPLAVAVAVLTVVPAATFAL
jgi:hypothetical protein